MHMTLYVSEIIWITPYEVELLLKGYFFYELIRNLKNAYWQ